MSCKRPEGALRYLAEEKNFRGASTGSILGAPDMGFMFPTFDDRMTNIYQALCYTRSSADVHSDFLKADVQPRQASDGCEYTEERI